MPQATKTTSLSPHWPDAVGHPVVLLVDASSALERRLVLDWIRGRRPAGDGYRLVEMAPSRRRRVGRRGPPAELRAALEDDGDTLLVPIRVAWLAPEKDGRRAAGLLDLLIHGDPRDPSRLRQHWITLRHPDRVTVIAGDPAPVSGLRRRWVAARDRDPDDMHDFSEFVALQASLALEKEERRLRGNRYKVPRFLAEDLLSRRSFRLGLIRIGEITGEPPAVVVKVAGRYLKEIAATHSTFVIDLVAALIRILYTQGYQRRILYDRGELRRLYELGQQYPLVFLPGHKSNLDHLVLMYVLYENGLPPNHTAGGINMNFLPVGPLLRRAGLFFIRRSFKDDETYKFVLKRYLDYLLSKRFPLQWFIEGGRSRSGKLRQPRFGLLSYVVDSYRRGSCDDAVLIPVAIAYDQIQDIAAYTTEARGGSKERESFSWMVRAIRTLRRRYGRIHLRFGEPLSLAGQMAPYAPGAEGEPDRGDVTIQKLAFEVAHRINQATPITPISLVTLALLGSRDRALTVAETMTALESFLEYVRRRRLPVAETLALDTEESVEAALQSLGEHGVVSRFVGGSEIVYSIEPDQHLAAAYYRNTIIHFFVDGAIAEVALLAAAERDGDRLQVFWEEVMGLRDLLKFEFFFPDKEGFRERIREEMARHRRDWEPSLQRGRRGALDVARAFEDYWSPWVLRPFIEAYRVAADALTLSGAESDLDGEDFVAGCMALGRQYLLQRRIRSQESVSTVGFETAMRLAANRGLISGGGPERTERREGFAAEIRSVLRHLDGVEALAAARRAGVGG